MVVQDAMTGALHEIEDGQVHETEIAETDPMGETVYDGLGNPVGFFSPLKFLGKLFGGGRRRKRAASPPPPPDPGPPPDALPDDSGAGEVYDGFGNPVGALFPFPRPPFPFPRPPFPLPRIGFPFGRRRVWSPTLRRFVSMVWNPAQRRWVAAGAAAAPAALGPGLMSRWRVPPGWMRPLAPVMGANRMYLRCSMWPGPAGLTPIGAGQPGMPGMPGARRRRRRYRRSRR